MTSSATSRQPRRSAGLRVSPRAAGCVSRRTAVSSPELAARFASASRTASQEWPWLSRAAAGVGRERLLYRLEDESWHRQRRFLAPIFTRRHIARDYVHIMTEEAERLVERWQGAASRAAVSTSIRDGGDHLADHRPHPLQSRRVAGAPRTHPLRSSTRIAAARKRPHPKPRWLPAS